MATILDHPQAQALLEQATLAPEQVAGCVDRLTTFLPRYLRHFVRTEQRQNAAVVLRGKLSGLSRKTSEPIAYQAGLPRKPIQSFVGWGPWDDAALLAELRAHVREAWPDPHAVFVVDGSGFPKKGRHSCGVARQWCGRLGKVENCQVGIFLLYACRHGHTGIDRQLFLPKEWTHDPARRHDGHVPAAIAYQEHWQLAAELIRRSGDVPHGWVTADSEFGRVVEFRALLRQRQERYVLDVPADTLVRDLAARRPPRRRKVGRKRVVPFVRVDVWAAQQKAVRWQRLCVRAGEKGPLQVEVAHTRVRPWAHGRKHQRAERLTVIRTVEASPRTWYTLSNAAADVSVAHLVRAHAERHRGEEVFEEGKGEVGLGQYEVRRWEGWHHHMTLSLLALWFLSLERTRVGGEKGNRQCQPTAGDFHAAAAATGTDGGADRRGDQLRTAA